MTHFAPETKNQAYYSDVNFELLGKIIEIVTHSTLEHIYRLFIFDILELENTYLPTTKQNGIPNIYYKNTPIARPKFLKSCPTSGGCITTTQELMKFIKAFFGGELFNISVFRNINYHKLQFSMYPIQYGLGYMRIPLSGFSTLFIGKGELIGHSGSTGSFAFYFPLKDLFFVGDFNQFANPTLPVRFVMRLAMSIK